MRAAVALALLAIAGCSAALASNSSAAAEAPLAQWLVGHWAEGEDCAVDFAVTYHEGGKLEASYRTGSWRVESGALIETITSHRTDDDPATPATDDVANLRVDPPETIRYAVERRGEDRAMLRSGNKSRTLRRC